MNEESVQQRLKSLQEVDLQDEAGLEVAIAALDDPVLEVRAQAYWILKDFDHLMAQQAVAWGVKVKPNDTFFCVYESAISFSDEFYFVHDEVSELECYLCVGFNINGERRISHRQSIEKSLTYGFQNTGLIVSNLVDSADFLEWAINEEESNEWICDECYSPQLRYAYINHSIAEKTAQKLALNIQKSNPVPLGSCDLQPYPENSEGFDLSIWCKDHEIQYTEMCRCRFLDVDYSDEGSWEHSYRFIEVVENYLLKHHQYELWEQLWSDAVGKLAFVKTLVVRELTYLPLSSTKMEVF